MPRTSSNGSTTRRRRTTTQVADTRLVVTQITQLVAANETLQRANRELTGENQRLRAELTAIGSALGSLTGGGRSGRGRRGAATLALPEAKPRQKRKPITDPEILARRGAALVKARAARAERLAGARRLVSPAPPSNRGAHLTAQKAVTLVKEWAARRGDPVGSTHRQCLRTDCCSRRRYRV